MNIDDHRRALMELANRAPFSMMESVQGELNEMRHGAAYHLGQTGHMTQLNKTFHEVELSRQALVTNLILLQDEMKDIVERLR